MRTDSSVLSTTSRTSEVHDRFLRSVITIRRFKSACGSRLEPPWWAPHVPSGSFTGRQPTRHGLAR